MTGVCVYPDGRSAGLEIRWIDGLLSGVSST
jgi:hypothetical protein